MFLCRFCIPMKKKSHYSVRGAMNFISGYQLACSDGIFYNRLQFSTLAATLFLSHERDEGTGEGENTPLLCLVNFT